MCAHTLSLIPPGKCLRGKKGGRKEQRDEPRPHALHVCLARAHALFPCPQKSHAFIAMHVLCPTCAPLTSCIPHAPTPCHLSSRQFSTLLPLFPCSHASQIPPFSPCNLSSFICPHCCLQDMLPSLSEHQFYKSLRWTSNPWTHLMTPNKQLQPKAVQADSSCTVQYTMGCRLMRRLSYIVRNEDGWMETLP